MTLTWPRLQPAIYAMQDTGPLPPERSDVAVALKAAPTARGLRKAWSPDRRWKGMRWMRWMRWKRWNTGGNLRSVISREFDTLGDLERNPQHLSRFSGGLAVYPCHDSWWVLYGYHPSCCMSNHAATATVISMWAPVNLWAAFCFVVPSVASVATNIFWTTKDLTKHQTSFC